MQGGVQSQPGQAGKPSKQEQNQAIALARSYAVGFGAGITKFLSSNLPQRNYLSRHIGTRTAFILDIRSSLVAR